MKKSHLIVLAAVSFSLYALAEEAKTSDKYKYLVGFGNSVLQQAPEKDTQSDQCDRQGVIYETQQKNILNAIEDSFLKKDVKGFTQLFSAKFTSSSLTQFAQSKVVPIDERLSVTHLSQAVELTQIKDLEKDIQTYFKKYKKIEKVEFKTSSIASDAKSPKAAALTINFIFKGILADGHRNQDAGVLQLDISQEKTKWLIDHLVFKDFKAIVNLDSPHFKQANLFTTDVYPRNEAIRRGGYALAVGDYMGDGNQSILVGAYGPMQIFRGDGKGHFTKDTKTNIPAWTKVKAAAWADLDNDGKQDLVIVRFIDNTPESQKVNKPDFKLFNNQSAILIYKNLGDGKFAEVKQSLNEGDVIIDRAMPLAIGDFNNDGLLDLYVGFPGVKDFTSFVSANDKNKYGHKVQGIYLNKGGFKFESKSMAKTESIVGQFGSDNILYPHSAMALDIDHNGTTDIAVLDDRGNLSPIYNNDGTGQFTKYNDDLKININGWAMSMAAADINNDGRIDVAASVVNYNSRQLYDKCMGHPIEKGISLFTNSPAKKSFTELKSDALEFSGEGMAGIEFIDYDQDGWQDLYAVNGLWSGTDKRSEDLSGPFLRTFRSSKRDPSILEENVSHTKSYVMDLLTQYKDKSGKSLAMAGYQANRLYKNIGGNEFVDVAYLEGIDSSYDGYIVAKADLNNDGVQDLILRNADPGLKSIKNPPLEIFLGQKTKNNTLILNLVGKTKNRDGIGAEVKVTTEGMPTQTQQLIANNGCAQSQKSLFFSLGKKAFADQVEIHWPGGYVQTINHLNSGIHTISEENQIVGSAK